MSTAATGSEQRLYTVSEVAGALQISRKTVYRMVRDGRLEAVRLSDGANAPIRIISRSLVAFLHDARNRQLARQAS